MFQIYSVILKEIYYFRFQVRACVGDNNDNINFNVPLLCAHFIANWKLILTRANTNGNVLNLFWRVRGSRVSGYDGLDLSYKMY